MTNLNSWMSPSVARTLVKWLGVVCSLNLYVWTCHCLCTFTGISFDPATPVTADCAVAAASLQQMFDSKVVSNQTLSATNFPAGSGNWNGKTQFTFAKLHFSVPCDHCFHDATARTCRADNQIKAWKRHFAPTSWSFVWSKSMRCWWLLWGVPAWPSLHSDPVQNKNLHCLSLRVASCLVIVLLWRATFVKAFCCSKTYISNTAASLISSLIACLCFVQPWGTFLASRKLNKLDGWVVLLQRWMVKLNIIFLNSIALLTRTCLLCQLSNLILLAGRVNLFQHSYKPTHCQTCFTCICACCKCTFQTSQEYREK